MTQSNRPLSRRQLLGLAGIAAAGTFAAGCAPLPTTPLSATPLPVPTRTPEPPVTNAAEALARLTAGNQRYVTQLSISPNQTIERREQVSGGQTPFAVILGCSDSRVPPEIVFDQGIGDLFVVRVAGNIFDNSVGLGSIEYAVEHFHCPLLLVLGHEKCGAVQATIDTLGHPEPLPGKIGNIVEAIKPAVEQAQGETGELLDNAVRANIRRVVSQLQGADPFLTELQAAGKLKITGARYALTSGAVEILA